MQKPELSVEFFPPQTEQGLHNLARARAGLKVLQPAFFSVTYGAGGSTRERSFGVIEQIAAEKQVEPCLHLTCIGAERERLQEILHWLKQTGIRRIVALRGDLPSGVAGGSVGAFRHANEMVAFIREHSGAHFHITVAAYPEYHPQAASAAADLDAFANKVKAGADAAITQYFYNADAYFDFVNEAHKRGVKAPMVPGIMPIQDFARLVRFSDACGAEVPRWMRRRFDSFGDDRASADAFALDVVTALCARLLEQGAPGLHFYSMNRAAATLEICHRLGLAPAPESAL